MHFFRAMSEIYCYMFFERTVVYSGAVQCEEGWACLIAFRILGYAVRIIRDGKKFANKNGNQWTRSGIIALLCAANRSIIIARNKSKWNQDTFLTSCASVFIAHDREPKRSSYLSLPINDPLQVANSCCAEPQKSKLYLWSGHWIITVGL